MQQLPARQISAITVPGTTSAKTGAQMLMEKRCCQKVTAISLAWATIPVAKISSHQSFTVRDWNNIKFWARQV